MPNHNLAESSRIETSVQVIEDPKQIRHVEQEYEKSCDRRYAAAIEVLRNSESVFAGLEDEIALRCDQAIKDLSISMNNTDGSARTRVRSAFQLARLGNPAGKDFIYRALGSQSVAMVRMALKEIQDDHYDKLGLQLNAPSYADLLLNSINSSDPETQKLAIYISIFRKVPGAEERILAALDRGLIIDETWASRILAWNATTPLAITKIADSICAEVPTEDPQNATWTAWRLERLLIHSDRACSEPIRCALHEAKLKYQGTSRYDPQVSKDLAFTAGSESTAVLEDIVANAKLPSSKAYATMALARLQPDKALDILLAFLRRERADVLEIDILAKYADGNRANEVIDVVAKDNQTLRIDAARLFWNNLGEVGRAFTSAHPARFDLHAQTWLHWIGNGLHINTAVQEMQTLGIISESADHILSRMKDYAGNTLHSLTSARRQPTDPFSLFDALEHSGFLFSYHTECGSAPCPHDQLIFRFAKATNCLLQPSASTQSRQTIKDDDQLTPYVVSFVVGKRMYQFNAQYRGDYYDEESVLAALNFALADLGRSERFIALDNGDQIASFVFADPKVFLPFAERYRLPLAKDPNEAMKQGKAFEQRAIERIRDHE